ncbi:histone-lysine N-methyltransferase, H3 lysine-9 specific SUVH4-like [Abrus precatorius]|uniref:Histone-lysine N-methyltransferase, H3 lysine-9 specific SUVH4-like n=1 Tax=Abrus precatorius TaxID=3816 RepID=A0A8B8LPQ6_ABRPR|nr:histone-lysine N-methyltransferase, H3 lysine-9 specific SUVH4-like [Abrus precatorius]
MVVITSCDDNVAATSNEIVVADEHPSKVSSDVSNIIVEQHPELTETNECLVEPRVSPPLENMPEVYEGRDHKRSMSGTDEDDSIQKRTKFIDPSIQQEPLVEVRENSGSSDCEETFMDAEDAEDGEDVDDDVEDGDDDIEDGEDSSQTFVFDELDFRGVLLVKESLRLFNVQTLEESYYKNKRAVRRKNNGLTEAFLTAKVEKYRNVEKQIPGLTTSKYLIEQLQEMAKLGMDKVHFAQEQISKALSDNPCLVCRDLSSGQELLAIPVTNEYDDPPIAPNGFTYIKSLQLAENIEFPPNDFGCKCKGNCRYSCRCAKLNGLNFPYVNRNGGRLTEARNVVFECGSNCGCGPNCRNKVSQTTIKYRLEVYRTSQKGWAVRTWDFVPSGAPVCEYVGILRKSNELDDEAENEYIFDVDFLQTIKGVDGRQKRAPNASLPIDVYVEEQDDETMEDEPEFCIDAGSYGNVARFINHSCEPNLFVQCVLSSHFKVGLARLVLFAGQNIHPYEELTYDYGYKLNSVTDRDGNIKQMPCYCGTAECRKRLY